MIAAVIRWCLQHHFLVFLFTAIVAGVGWYCLVNTPIDAIPDIGEKQVIVYADWPGRSPQDVEDQVTYPLAISLQGTPGVKTIRSASGFGFSMVFVIFKDEVDYYWARSRVLERMNVATARLPAGVVPVLGPDATALGQIYWYTLEAPGVDLAQLRSLQDWYVRYQLQSVEGVSEVASVGGFVKQYQIDVHPDKLRAHRVTLEEVTEAVRRSNIDVGAKVVENSGYEFFIRGVGFLKSVEDVEHIVIRQERGTPLYVKNVATVQLGSDFRRSLLDKGGREAVGGVVTMRYGENPLAVIDRVKQKIREMEPGLRAVPPDGHVVPVRIVSFYDRTDIIRETMDTLREALTEEALVAGLVVVIFLLHLRSTLTILPTLPLSVGMSFIVMYWLGVDSNIMSLAGIAIAIGDVADMGIIMTENIYRRVAAEPGRPHRDVVFEAAVEVGRPILTAVSNTIVSFIPVFALTDQEGKLFKPLAYTKTFAISASVILALVVVPMLCHYLLRPGQLSRRRSFWLAVAAGVAATVVSRAAMGYTLSLGHSVAGWPMALAIGGMVGAAVYRMGRERLLPLEENLVARCIHAAYRPTLEWVLAHKAAFLAVPIAIALAGMTIWLGFSRVAAPLRAGARAMGIEVGEAWWWQELAARFPGIGREFMPPLDEGSLLYMPSLLPSASLTEVQRVLAQQDLAIQQVPEVASVVGKASRVESALDPAPIGMIETIILLKPPQQWRMVDNGRAGKRRITKEEILAELEARTNIPGVLPTWLQPIQTRIVMLQTGFRAMMGVKIYGADPAVIEQIGLQMERS
jgi:Cu(I)/Ag(I) efflux system membrane protein CusA/SilA